MAHQVVLNQQGAYRILLEEYAEGTYVYVFENENSQWPYRDWLQDDLEMAMRACKLDYGVSVDQWQVVPDEKWHG